MVLKTTTTGLVVFKTTNTTYGRRTEVVQHPGNRLPGVLEEEGGDPPDEAMVLLRQGLFARRLAPGQHPHRAASVSVATPLGSDPLGSDLSGNSPLVELPSQLSRLIRVDFSSGAAPLESVRWNFSAI